MPQIQMNIIFILSTVPLGFTKMKINIKSLIY